MLLSSIYVCVYIEKVDIVVMWLRWLCHWLDVTICCDDASLWSQRWYDREIDDLRKDLWVSERRVTQSETKDLYLWCTGLPRHVSLQHTESSHHRLLSLCQYTVSLSDSRQRHLAHTDASHVGSRLHRNVCSLCLSVWLLLLIYCICRRRWLILVSVNKSRVYCMSVLCIGL